MLTDRPPAGPGWLHEVKHDGIRVLACRRGEGLVRTRADFAEPRRADGVGSYRLYGLHAFSFMLGCSI